MRRTPTIRPANQLALALAEIERLKAITTRVTDGRVIVTVPGTTPGDGHTGDGDLPPIETSAHVLYGSKHTNSFLVTAAEGVSLIARYQAGQIWIGGAFITVDAGTLLMTDAATNYMFVQAGGVATNTTGFPLTSAPLAEVVAAGGTITAVNDRRSYLLPGAGTSGSLHDADQIIDADTDTSVEVERGADDDTIRFRAATVDVALIASAGQWQLPITGVGAGILLGGDAQLYRSAADVVALGVGDTLRVDDANFLLAMSGGDPRITFDANDYLTYARGNNYYAWIIGSIDQMYLTAAGQLQLPITGSGGGILIGGDVQLYRSNPNELYINDDVVIPDTRRLLIGNDTSVSFAGDVSLSFLGTGSADTRMGIGRWANDSAGAALIFLKSRDPVIGSQTIVQNNDIVGGVSWLVDDGVDNTNYVAWMFAGVDGVPAAGDTPGKLLFYTTPPASGTPTLRMTLSSAGQLAVSAQGLTGGLLIGGDVTLYRASGTLLGTGHTVIGEVGSSAGRSVLNVTATSNPVGRSLIEAHIRSATSNDLVFRVRDTGDVLMAGGLEVNGVLTRARKPIVAKAGAYTITIDDEVIIADASGASFTITLPTAVGISGKTYWIKKIDATANTVTVDADGAETIDDGLTAILETQYEAITVVSDGTEWWVI